MDERASDPNNPAKRRCLNDRNSDCSDSLFVSQSPEPTTAECRSRIEDSVSDDDDDDSEPDGDEPKYDEHRETLPECLAFDPKVEDCKAAAVEAVTNLINKMKQHASANKDLENMITKAAESMKSRQRKPIIGTWGATGAGKSALINSLIGTIDLAKELSGGEACTSVPTIYVHELPGQTDSFAAKVSYYSVQDCQKFLKRLLSSYNRFHFNPDKYWTPKKKTEYEQEANTAFATLRTLFCDKPEFEARQSTINTLARSHTKSGRSDLLRTMVRWYEESLREKSQKDDVKFTFCQSNTVVGLRAALDPLITPKYDYSVPSLLPLVEQVTVGDPSSKILLYLILVDLPGFSDTNKMRVRATLRHLQKCDALWCVVPVDRPISDPDLGDAIKQYSDRFPGKLAIVVTKVDKDVTDALAEDMRGKCQNLGDYDECNNSLDQQNACLRSVRAKLKKKSLTSDQKDDLRDEEQRLSTHIEKLKLKKSSCVIDARNARVVAGLHEKVQHLRKGTTLPVFCVSSRHYAHHKGSNAPIEGQLLDVEPTGIPKLRSYAISLAAPAIWDDTEEIFKHKPKILIHGVHIWTEPSSIEREKGLTHLFKPAKSLWESEINASADRCIRDFSSNIMGKLRAKHESSVEGMMDHFYHIRDEWSPLTFLAFFRQHGNHSTKAVPSSSWNEDFLRRQKDKVLIPAWDASPDPVDFFDKGIEKLIKKLEDITAQLNSKPESVPLNMASFVNALSGHIGTIRTERNRVKREYRLVYANVRLNACFDQPEGYFTQVMKPCYHAGKGDKGEGVCERVKNLMWIHLNQKYDPLSQANDRLQKALETAARDQASSLDIAVKKILDNINDDFEAIWKKKSETFEEAEARSKIGEALRELMPKIARIETDLTAIEAEYKMRSRTTGV